jgi:hypothetical protein
MGLKKWTMRDFELLQSHRDASKLDLDVAVSESLSVPQFW